MAVTQDGPYFTRAASADLSAKQYYAVKLDSSAEVALAGANEAVIGILNNKPQSGEEASVKFMGTSKAIVSEAVSIMDRLTPTVAGKLEVVDLADEKYCAIALEAATADGDIIEVMLVSAQASAV